MARIDTLKNFLVDIADKFRSILGTTEEISHAEYDAKIDEVFETGKEDMKTEIAPINAELEKCLAGEAVEGKTWYDKFWDSYQIDGKRRDYAFSFAGMAWNSENFKPKYPIILKSSSSYNESGNMFEHFDRNLRKAPLEIKEGDIDFQLLYSMGGMFKNANISIIEMNAIPDQLTSMTDTFCQNNINSNVLHTIKIGVRKETSYSAQTFRAGRLKNVSFVDGSEIGKNIIFEYTKVLTRESIENIINVLSETTSGTAATFSKISVDTAFETAEGLADGTSSDEWKALIATKPNWTISLV